MNWFGPELAIPLVALVVGALLTYFIVKAAVVAAIRETRNDPPKTESAPPVQ